MRGRWLVNLLLLGLVLLLGTLIQRELTQARISPTLSDLAASDLLLIEIAREGEPSIELSKSPQGWRMDNPMRMDANQAQVDQLLAILDTPVRRSFPGQSADLDELGLAKPGLRLRLDTLDLALGGIDPVGNDRYVASEGVIHLIDDRFYHLLIAPPIDYVSRRLLPLGFTPVFGRVDDVPLAAETLAGLEEVVAERIETPPEEDPEGTAVEFKAADGTVLNFQVSEDRRRWRLDASRDGPSLRYVLTTAPTLTEDPGAIDPTPPAPPPDAVMTEPDIPGSDLDGLPNAPFDQMPSDLAAPYPPLPELEPDAIVPGDALLGPPPEVRLGPEDQAPLSAPRRNVLHGEPDKAPPAGFGQDPFAPAPGMGEEPALDQR